MSAGYRIQTYLDLVHPVQTRSYQVPDFGIRASYGSEVEVNKVVCPSVESPLKAAQDRSDQLNTTGEIESRTRLEVCSQSRVDAEVDQGLVPSGISVV